MKQIWKDRNCKNGFVLRTMSRSGSHYAMNILANENEDIVNQSKYGLQTLSTFGNLADIVYVQNNKYLNDLQYKFDEIEITSMWSNHLKPGQSHPPHTHSNNLLSGVFYLNSEFPATPIQFFDPRPQANILSPRNEPNKYNVNN